MKTLKRIIAITIICLTLNIVIPAQFSYSSFIVEAHSGRTDSSGGHKDNKNKSGLGYYHYHHGYPAHLHKNGVCPYANGYIGSSSSNSSSSSQWAYNTYSTNSTNNTTQNNNIQEVSGSNIATPQTIVILDTSYDNVAFNASYYANKYTDVYKAYGNNAQALYNHFISSGIVEGRQSSANFSILVYKENNPDLFAIFGDDLINYYNHFITFGINENRISK